MEVPCRKHGASPKKMALCKEAIKTSRGSRVVRRDTIFVALSSRKKKKAAPHQVARRPFVAECFLSQVAAEALDALAGIFKIGGFGRVGNPERRAEAERGTLHDGHAFVLQ